MYAAGDPWRALPPVDTSLFTLRTEETEDTLPRLRPSVVLPRDTLALLDSDYLPESPYSTGVWLTTDPELEQLADVVALSRSSMWALGPPAVRLAPFDAGLMRYNRVEGLTIGGSARVTRDPFSAAARAWIGHADLTPSVELELGRSLGRRESLLIYSQLQAFTPADRPFGLGNSLGSFLFGRDEGDYYRASGLAFEITRSASTIRRSAWSAAAFAELQRNVSTQASASVAHWSKGTDFRPNPPADHANQFGVETHLDMRRGLDPAGASGALALRMSAQAGTFRFVKPSVSAGFGFPLPGRLVGSVEGAGGTIFGTAPLQSLWYLGGPSTVRAFDPVDRLSGDTFWRSRAEIATERPAFRLVGFTDLGWAGSRDAIDSAPRLVSAGVGASTLDGLLRVDVARAVRGGSGWGVQLYLDAAL